MNHQQADSLKQAAGQDILMIGYAGYAGAAALAKKHQTMLEEHFNSDFLQGHLGVECGDCEDVRKMSVDVAVRTAIGKKTDLTLIQEVGEGGIFAALWQLGVQAECGLRVWLKQMPIRQDSIEICDFLGVNPYMILSTGCVLLTTNHGQQLKDALMAENIETAVIGYLTNDKKRIVINGEEERYLEPYRPWRLQTEVSLDEIEKSV